MTQSSLVLVINCGSSSIKFALVDGAYEQKLISGLAERLGSPEARLSWRSNAGSENQATPALTHTAAMNHIMRLLQQEGFLNEPLTAVGHRVVHGGEAFTASTLINNGVIAAIEACSRLAPLHNPANLRGIRAAQQLFSGTPQVAVFDTAFHQTLPPFAYLYPIPYELYKNHGVRRYGFHGTSHRYVTQRAAELLGKPASESNFISAHLGNGCSATAVKNGRSVDTTMGLTPLEGLMMGTRSGDVDPALHQFLRDDANYNLDQTINLLNNRSGLLGVSGLSNDMRALLDAANDGHERAAIAIDLFCYRLAKAIAALAVPLGRVDALIFTGGIGENAPPVRARVLQQLTILGYTVDKARNEENGRSSHGVITPPNNPVALVVPTDEELMIARDSMELVTGKQ